jgi:hypothetical protein
MDAKYIIADFWKPHFCSGCKAREMYLSQLGNLPQIYKRELRKKHTSLYQEGKLLWLDEYESKRI